MRYLLNSLTVLSLYVTHIFASPVADLEVRNEDCYMEWITVYGDAPTSSSASPTLSTAALAGAGKPIMRHSRHTTSTVAASAASPSSATMAADALKSETPVEGATSYVSSSAAAISSSATSSAASPPMSTGGSTGMSPGGKKAGISGFEGITSKAAWTQFTSKISWYSDYTPNPADSGSVKGIGMVRFPRLCHTPRTDFG